MSQPPHSHSHSQSQSQSTQSTKTDKSECSRKGRKESDCEEYSSEGGADHGGDHGDYDADGGWNGRNGWGGGNRGGLGDSLLSIHPCLLFVGLLALGILTLALLAYISTLWTMVSGGDGSNALSSTATQGLQTIGNLLRTSDNNDFDVEFGFDSGSHKAAVVNVNPAKPGAPSYSTVVGGARPNSGVYVNYNTPAAPSGGYYVNGVYYPPSSMSAQNVQNMQNPAMVASTAPNTNMNPNVNPNPNVNVNVPGYSASIYPYTMSTSPNMNANVNGAAVVNPNYNYNQNPNAMSSPSSSSSSWSNWWWGTANNNNNNNNNLATRPNGCTCPTIPLGVVPNGPCCDSCSSNYAGWPAGTPPNPGPVTTY